MHELKPSCNLSPAPPVASAVHPQPAWSRWGQSDARLLCQTLFLIDGWHTASTICVCERPCFINRLQREFSSINVYEGSAGLNIFLLWLVQESRGHRVLGEEVQFSLFSTCLTNFFFPFPMRMLKSENSCSLLFVLSLKNKANPKQTQRRF